MNEIARREQVEIALDLPQPPFAQELDYAMRFLEPRGHRAQRSVHRCNRRTKTFRSLRESHNRLLAHEPRPIDQKEHQDYLREAFRFIGCHITRILAWHFECLEMQVRSKIRISLYWNKENTIWSFPIFPAVCHAVWAADVPRLPQKAQYEETGAKPLSLEFGSYVFMR